MKRITLTALALFCFFTFAGAEEQTLSSWKLRQEGTRKSYNVEVPTTVAGALADNGVLPEDILESLNYFDVDKSIFDNAWTFTTKFKTPGRKGDNVLLQFNSLNFYADIELNGKKIASSDTTEGMFLIRQYDITGKTRSLRRNKLSVTLRRAQKGDLNLGFVDWNPRPLDESMGINGAVTVKSVKGVEIADTYVKPVLETLDQADLLVNILLRNHSGKAVNGTLTLSYENGCARIPVEVPAEGTSIKLSPAQIEVLHVDNPRLWWTWDLGTPELYNMEARFEVDGGTSDTDNVTFGIRSVTSTVVNNYRQFFLNGRPVLVKGAGWTDEIFLRDTHESNLLQAEYVVDMNMNCIRFENIWGKDDDIYDCCDRLGLLAMVGWSCQWEWEDYCGLPETDECGCIADPRSIDMAARYFHDQVIRLHNHPSIFCWLTGSDRIPCEELEKRYFEIYDEYEYRPYVCSAKDMTSVLGGPSGTKMEGPYEYVGPDYWYLDEDCGGAFGFNTETGIGLNMPQIPSLKKMFTDEGLWPVSKEWDKHCTASSSAMNNTEFLTGVINAQYGEVSTLEEYVNRAHAIDYDATRAMFEAFRCNIPVSTGIIQWMLNSAWPSLYWQLFDFYKVPTAAYYGTRKGCEPVQLIYNYKDKSVYAVNETGADRTLTAAMKVYGEDSEILNESAKTFVAADNASIKVFDVPAHDSGIFLALEVLDEESRSLADNFYCIPARNNEYNWSKATWYYTPVTRYSDMSFVSDLAQAEVAMDVTKEGNVYTVTLDNRSESISYQNILQMTGADGTLITPAFWSDNFVTVLPGQTKTLTCKVPDGMQGTVNVQTWNTTIK